jgi:tRNA (guanine-N7-)-methyltransferase
VTAAAAEAPPPERVQFYGRRRGRRLRPGRQLLLAEALPRLVVPRPAPGEIIEPHALFAGRVTEVWLEIGFGAGEHLLAQAAANPEAGLLGCEVFIDGIAALLAARAIQPADNIRIFTDDARLLLDALAVASLARVFILFPDPWPKARHHRRRLIDRHVVARLAALLQDGGELRLATDHAGYARWMLAHVLADGAFTWTARRPLDWRRPPADWVATRYQQRAERMGSAAMFLQFRRLPRAECEALARKSLVPLIQQDI